MKNIPADHVHRMGLAPRGWLVAFLASLLPAFLATTSAQPLPQLVDSNLNVRPVVSGLMMPTSMAFIGADDILVLEKATGRVLRVMNGVVQATVLDLAVNFGSERGLLGIALHPQFPANPGVYLFWTESTTGMDTNVLSATPLLGNRVDRFIWNGATLTMDMNIIRLRALQEDAGQPARGNPRRCNAQ
jgi:glucose/arabinose dehydrogenase